MSRKRPPVLRYRDGRFWCGGQKLPLVVRHRIVSAQFGAPVSTRKKQRRMDAESLDLSWRNHCRMMLSDLLSDWRYVFIPHGPDGAYLMRGGELIRKFNWGELRRTMTKEHYDLLRILYAFLEEQSAVAGYAVPIARVELGISDKRATPRKPEAPKAELVRAKAAELVKKKLNPYARIPWLANAAKCSQRYVRKVLSEGGKRKRELK